MFKIPLVPQWNLNSGCVFTPDGGLLYAGSRTINFINTVEGDNQAPIIQSFNSRQVVISLDVDPHWGQKDSTTNEDVDTNPNLEKNAVAGDKGKEPAKLFAALLADNSVQIWDFNKGCAIQGHKAHSALCTEGGGALSKNANDVHISYMCNRNVLSVNKQDIVVYCVASNSFYSQPMFISSRQHQVNFLKCSPYSENLFAIGTKRGLVLVCDLKKMNILYKLMGNHDSIITSLAWNRVKNSVEQPKEATKYIAPQKQETKGGKLSRSPARLDMSEPPKEATKFIAPQNEETKGGKLSRSPARLDMSEPPKDASENQENKGGKLSRSPATLDMSEPPKELSRSPARLDMTEPPNEATKFIAPQNQETKGGKLSRSPARLDMSEMSSTYDLDKKFGVASQEMKLKDDFLLSELSKFNPKFPYAYSENWSKFHGELETTRDKQSTSPEQTSSSQDNFSLSLLGTDDDKESAAKDKDSMSDNESSGSSLDDGFRCNTTSSEDSIVLDGMQCYEEHNIIHQADVHHSPPQDNEQLKCKEALDECVDDVEKISESNITIDKKIKEDEFSNTKPNEVYDMLLAATSADGTLYIWNATTGGTCDTKKIRATHGGKNLHIEVSWISSTTILVNNNAGALQLWGLEPVVNNQSQLKTGFRSYKFKEIKREWSQRSVISFASSPKHHIVWCISSNRVVSLENIELNKTILNYSCVSTNIGAMQECPDDMNKIALGFSDRRIGLIDVSKITQTSVHIDNYVQRIEPNVMTIAWRPDCKKLAYATMEGRIGVLTVDALNKQPFCYNSIGSEAIYSICWQEKFIYVVCKHLIAVYEDDTNKRDPYIIPDIEDVTCISLRNQYLFVGTKSGQLQLFVREDSPNLLYKQKLSLKLASRYIADICWNPIAKNKLAVVANANTIQILEFNDETADLQKTRKIEIKDKQAANGCIKWSNRNENCFLTCGLDGAVRVWDLSNDTNPEIFVKSYNCPMTCGLFLPTNDEVILCSGKTAALEIIDMRIEKTEPISDKSKPSKTIRTLDNITWASKALASNEPKSRSKDKKLKRLAKSLQNTVAADESVEGKKVDSKEITALMENLDLKNTEQSSSNVPNYMKKVPTLLYLSKKEFNRDALDIMFSILSSPNSRVSKSLTEKLFGTKDEAMEVFALELKNNKKSDAKGIPVLLMSQIQGDLKHEISKCVRSKQLTEWHVSLAPSVSHGFWESCCRAFADQLFEEGYILQAATYMMCVHEHHKVIYMLSQQNMFKEAYLISRVYFQPEYSISPAIADVWIQHLIKTGNLTGAALLCLLTKKPDRAYDCLVKIRNSDPEVERVIRILKPLDIDFI